MANTKKVRSWFDFRLRRFIVNIPESRNTMKELIGELRAIVAEAELRIKHPNFPSNE